MTETSTAPERAVPGLEALRRMERRRPGQESIARTAAVRAGSSSPSVVHRMLGGSPVGSAERAAFDAARGERIVGRELDALPNRWIVLHSLPSPGTSGDLDHVIVGPGGVFAVTTRFVAGADVIVGDDDLVTSGRRMPFARSAVSAARRVAQLAGRSLPPGVAVRGVVVVAGARTVRRGSRHRVVDVREAAAVREWLESHPPVLDDDAVEGVAVQIAQSYEATAGALPRGVTASTVTSAAIFARLERESAVARRIRVLWRAVGVAVLTGALWVSFTQLPAWLALHLG
ncbi:nuclease-like protein [Labedella gwakjiensis]|uniref:NERD domain-containing protein n=1 Tax=Labedella gwakjiensis TaxID=390269 RepID=A0A2P8GVF8_9MICO|nr:nuclease-related domain-containing protein [Labedella gwakjiensis]PSL37935.1 nuclease-like protein [Labedella gwakjiensis]RUQ87499.1 NERD domain-containing protein [Labedella gwakjiensis]